MLVVDGTAYGAADQYGKAVRAALEDETDSLNWLSGYQHLLSLCKSDDQKAALDQFCPANWEMKVGE